MFYPRERRNLKTKTVLPHLTESTHTIEKHWIEDFQQNLSSKHFEKS